ncbi:hypothetical protein [Halococcoides cellulosivorans]|uniref:hypothetical protein n=1 Tax=Halococcoides cellulosivorans TaxID=1679096 RepID=UPI00131F3D3E|nr:hypothetical protein [Halococcoides cellulosivorans]
MLTISARESVRQVIETLLFVGVVLVGSVGAIGAGLVALSTVVTPGAFTRATITASPGVTVAGAVAVLFGIALFAAGVAVLAVETVASGVRIGLDRSAALGRPSMPRRVASPVGPTRPATTSDTTTHESVDAETTDAAERGRRETPDPADWTARNSVERSRSSESDLDDEWVFKGEESSDEADRTA